MLLEEEVVEELEVKVGWRCRVDMRVVLGPPESEGKFELTLRSPLTSILQLRK